MLSPSPSSHLSYACHADGLDVRAVQCSRRLPSRRAGQPSHALGSGSYKKETVVTTSWDVPII